MKKRKQRSGTKKADEKHPHLLKSKGKENGVAIEAKHRPSKAPFRGRACSRRNKQKNTADYRFRTIGGAAEEPMEPPTKNLLKNNGKREEDHENEQTLGFTLARERSEPSTGVGLLGGEEKAQS